MHFTAPCINNQPQLMTADCLRSRNRAHTLTTKKNPKKVVNLLTDTKRKFTKMIFIKNFQHGR